MSVFQNEFYKIYCSIRGGTKYLCVRLFFILAIQIFRIWAAHAVAQHSQPTYLLAQEAAKTLFDAQCGR